MGEKKKSCEFFLLLLITYNNTLSDFSIAKK